MTSIGRCIRSGVPPLYGADTTVGGIADPYAWGFALVAL